MKRNTEHQREMPENHSDASDKDYASWIKDTQDSNKIIDRMMRDRAFCEAIFSEVMRLARENEEFASIITDSIDAFRRKKMN